MTINFEGKVAIVTGAGGGLGRCHALDLATFPVVVRQIPTRLDGPRFPCMCSCDFAPRPCQYRCRHRLLPVDFRR